MVKERYSPAAVVVVVVVSVFVVVVVGFCASLPGRRQTHYNLPESVPPKLTLTGLLFLKLKLQKKKKLGKVNPERIDICFEICFEQVPRKLDQKS